MEDKEDDFNIIPSNDDLPPDPLTSEEINNKNINNINSKNNNNIINNINKSNNNNGINIGKQIPYNFNPILLKYPMHQDNNNMMYLNYINQIQRNNINNINNLFVPYNNNLNSINNINNENQVKNNSNLHDLTININSETLIKLSKAFLIDIIAFIRDICKIKIDPKYNHLKHQIFKIYKDRDKDNGYLFMIKKNKLDKIDKIMSQKFKHLNGIGNIINDSDISDDDDDEKDNIINYPNNNIKNRINIQKNKYKIHDTFYCKVHDRVFINIDYKYHCQNHKK